MKKLINIAKTTGTATLLAMGTIHGAVAQTLSQAPLEQTILVEPNVMLLLDDSLSMNNLTTASGYDGSFEYDTNWEFQYIGVNAAFIPNNIPAGGIGAGGCPAVGTNPYFQATHENTGETRCIRVPDPNTGNGLADTLMTENYLRYLVVTFTTAAAPNADLTGNPLIPDATRVDVLRLAAEDVVTNVDNVRWCVSDLLNANNDTVPSSVCSDNPATSVAAIQALDLDGGGTPLAQTMFNIVRYFEQPFSNGGPVDYRCQANNVVVITDGYPTSEDLGVGTDLPGTLFTRADYNLPADTAAEPFEHPGDPALTVVRPAGQSIPEWDGFATPTTANQFFLNDIPVGSDGVDTFNAGAEGGTLLLDDIALFADEIDLFRTGNDLAGEPFLDATDPDDSLLNHNHQNIITHTVGFGLQNQMLADAATYGKGINGQAQNAAQLTALLSRIGANVSGQGTSTGAASTTTFLAGDNQIFQVGYNTESWSGTLQSFSLNSNPLSDDFGTLDIDNPNFSTNLSFTGTDGFTDENGVTTVSSLTPDNRNILTVNSETDLGVEFEWLDLSDAQRANLNNDEDLLDYLRGDQSQEEDNGGNFRDRPILLGDVIHSGPVFVANADFGYVDPDYQSFLTAIDGRDQIVYVGSNDGFLHGFHADLSDAATLGQEAFAFAPQSTIPLMAATSDPDYEHHYAVDGRFTAIDVQLDASTQPGEWATVLLGSMGAGGTSIFGLDITDPADFSNLAANGDDIFLWEVSDTFPVEPDSAGASNLALSGSASQSSTAFNGPAELAIDGNTDGNYGNGSVTHSTVNELTPWWEVELDSVSELNQIMLFNRTDGNQQVRNRLTDFSIFVSTEPFVSGPIADIRAQAGVTEFSFPGTAGAQETIDLLDIPGRFVRVQLNNVGILSLAEVQINGTPLIGQYRDLGRTLDRLSAVRVITNPDPANTETRWIAITGNGVHSTDGNAVFYAIDLNTGEKVQEVVLDDTGDNGIISNTAIDLNGDDNIDRVYLTDIKGNIWRLNWNENTDQFESEYTSTGGDPVAFFQSREAGDNSEQVVTAAVEVIRVPGRTDTVMTFFGTGKYYDIEDAVVRTTDQEQSFYGVIDEGAPASGTFTTLTRGDLEEQMIRLANITGATDGEARAVDGDPVDFSSQSGWVIDLPTLGERVIFDPIAISDRISFTTLIPPLETAPDPCLPALTGWLMEVDALNGISTESITFDVNRDGDFDSSDTTALTGANGGNLQVAGIRPASGGAPTPPAVIRIDSGLDNSGATGVLDSNGNSSDLSRVVFDGDGNVEQINTQTPISRTSWRQLN